MVQEISNGRRKTITKKTCQPKSFFFPNSIFSVNSLQIAPETYLLEYTFNITDEYIYIKVSYNL